MKIGGDILMNFIMAQVIGLIGAIMSMIAAQMKEKKK